MANPYCSVPPAWRRGHSARTAGQDFRRRERLLATNGHVADTKESPAPSSVSRNGAEQRRGGGDWRDVLRGLDARDGRRVNPVRGLLAPGTWRDEKQRAPQQIRLNDSRSPF